MIVLPILMFLAALVTQLAGTGHLSRNGLVGIRTRSTRASDEAWRVGHDAAALPTWIGFAAVTAVAIAFWSFAGSVIIGTLCVSLGIALVLGTVAWSLGTANRAARALTPS